MANPKQTSQTAPGFGVIEVLVAATIFSVSVIAIWSIFVFANTQVAVARTHTVAANLVNEKIEIIRNMPYEDLGTTTGNPNGSIPATAVISRNGINYTVNTVIRYYDHAADGLVSGLVTGKHVKYWPADCSFDFDTAGILKFDFYGSGDVFTLDFADYINGNNFNWSGKFNVDGQDQHFHLHSDDIGSGCEKLRLQTQNVEEPFSIYVDDVLWVTYTAPDTFTPAAGYSYEIVGSGGESLTDLYPNDFKQVDVSACWDHYPCPKPVRMTTFVAQRGQETAENTGVLRVEVLDASGAPVPNAGIHIENSVLGMPAIDETTAIDGLRLIPVLDPSVESYEITVTKSGYSADQTYGVTVGNPNPYPIHLTVNAGAITEPTFVIDLLSAFEIDVVGLDDAPAASTDIDIVGTKVISNADPYIQKYPLSTFTTDGSGHLTLSDMEFDTYEITAKLASGDVVESVYLEPNTTLSLYISPHTLTITVEDSTDSSPLEDAEVTLSKPDISYESLISSDVSGETSFTSLHTGDHEYSIELSGYQSATDTVTIAPGANTLTVQLTPDP